MSATNVPSLLLDRLASTPDREAFRTPKDGGWQSFSWGEIGARVRAIASGLRALGVKPEERCGILCSTRLEWVLADLAILTAGGVTTTVYPSSTPDEAVYILGDSAWGVVFVENDVQLGKLLARRADLPGVRKVIVIDGGAGQSDWVISLADLEAKGLAAGEGDLVARARAIPSTALATLIYTSGTTGRPKGVELTHDSWVYEAGAVEKLGILGADDVQMLWLPLAHSFGKVLLAVQLAVGFVTAIDGRVDKLVENLAVVRPTFVAVVPRILEKVHARMVTTAQSAGGLKSKIFRWAIGVGRDVSRLAQQGQAPSAALALRHRIADKLVLSKLRARFGGRVRFFISGSAPLSREIAEFCHAFGVLVLEGYGLTESSAASFVNLPDRYQFGTVGPPIPGVEVKIASDGEILLKGRGIMRGYRGLPEATAETLEDGWLRTGDIGELTERGLLRITDRKKDLIKTSGGKYVAPQAIEGKLKALCPYLSQVVVHGDRRPFCTALITLDADALRAWGKEHGLSETDEALARSDRVRALIAGYVDELNRGLARHETIKRFAILPVDLSLENDELTPSLKVKRKVVERRHRAVLDGLYADAGDVAA